MSELSLDGMSVAYDVIHCARKTLGVAVSPSGKVVIRAPYNTTRAHIADFAERLKPWVFKQLARYRQTCPLCGLVTGENIPYLGKKYKLRVTADGAGLSPILGGGCLRVWVERDLNEEVQREAVRQSLSGWYEVQAQQILPARLDMLALRLGMHPAAVKVKRQVRRWGSCTARGVINLNWQLVMAPLDVIDYVLIHELCHLRVYSHQREFWGCVVQYMPDYKKQRKWLRVNSNALNFLSR